MFAAMVIAARMYLMERRAAAVAAGITLTLYAGPLVPAPVLGVILIAFVWPTIAAVFSVAALVLSRRVAALAVSMIATAAFYADPDFLEALYFLAVIATPLTLTLSIVFCAGVFSERQSDQTS